MDNLVIKYQPEFNKLCQKYGITYLAAFGSRSRSDYKKNSDLDLLVSFNHDLGLLDLINIEQKMSDLVGVKVDLITKQGLSKYIRPYIQDDLKIIYDQKS